MTSFGEAEMGDLGEGKKTESTPASTVIYTSAF